MINSRNPDSNSILQALLDLTDYDSNLGALSINDAIKELQSNKNLGHHLQEKWNAHTYKNSDLKWTQLTIDADLMELSGTALKVLILLGSYAHQSTLIQVSYTDLAAITGYSQKSVRSAIKELKTCGCIKITEQASRHEAQIYSVNPAIINKGKRESRKIEAYEKPWKEKDNYILNRMRFITTKTIHRNKENQKQLVYNKISLNTNEEQKPVHQDKIKSPVAPTTNDSTPELNTTLITNHMPAFNEKQDELKEIAWW